MPTYDYVCEANGQVVEVKHRMSENVTTWGELCALAQIDAGDTPVDARVKRLANGGQFLRSGTKDPLPPCQTGGGCAGGGCQVR